MIIPLKEIDRSKKGKGNKTREEETPERDTKLIYIHAHRYTCVWQIYENASQIPDVSQADIVGIF